MEEKDIRNGSLINSRLYYASQVLYVALFGVALFHFGAKAYFNRLWNWGPDKMYQVAATEQWIAGHGISITEPSVNDLSAPSFRPLWIWPPGYSILLATCLHLSDDVYFATVLVEWVAVALLLGSWFVILHLMEGTIGVSGKLFIALLWALGLSIRDTSTGLLANALFSSGMALCLWSVARRRHFLWSGVLSGILIAGSTWVRFAFWPLVMVAPIALALCARRFDSRLRRMAVANGIACWSLFGLLVSYQKWISGHWTFFENLESCRGFFPGNLAAFHPFPADAFCYDLCWWQSLPLPGEPKPLAAWLLFSTKTAGWLISLIILCAFAWSTFHCWRTTEPSASGATRTGVIARRCRWLVGPTIVGVLLFLLCTHPWNVGLWLLTGALLYWMLRPSPAPSPPLDESLQEPDAKAVPFLFYSWAVLTIFLTVGMLMFLSVRYSFPDWTYVQEARYFTPALPFLLVGVVAAVTCPAISWRPLSGFVGSLTCLIIVVPILCGGDLVHIRQDWRAFRKSLKTRLWEERFLPKDCLVVWKAIEDASAQGRSVVYMEQSISNRVAFVTMKGGQATTCISFLMQDKTFESNPPTTKALTLFIAIPRDPAMLSPAGRRLASFLECHRARKVASLEVCWSPSQAPEYIMELMVMDLGCATNEPTPANYRVATPDPRPADPE
jgi:hypothetical protein